MSPLNKPLVAATNIKFYLLEKVSFVFLSLVGLNNSHVYELTERIKRSKRRVTEGVFFFFIGAFATKSFERSMVLRYGLLQDFFSKGQKTTAELGEEMHVRVNNVFYLFFCI